MGTGGQLESLEKQRGKNTTLTRECTINWMNMVLVNVTVESHFLNTSRQGRSDSLSILTCEEEALWLARGNPLCSREPTVTMVTVIQRDPSDRSRVGTMGQILASLVLPYPIKSTPPPPPIFCSLKGTSECRDPSVCHLRLSEPFKSNVLPCFIPLPPFPPLPSQ